MDSQQCPRICPLCGSPVGLFRINYTEKLLMCEDPMCDYPFGYEELQIVTDETQLRENIEWTEAQSLPDNDMSSVSSIVSTTGWADIEQLTKIYDSDSGTNDTKLCQQRQLSTLAKKRIEKKKYDEEMAQNLNYIKKLNKELNQLKRKDRYSRIEKDNLLENLLRLQKMSGRQILKREELEDLQKKKDAELGMGELKININTVPNEMGVINIEICNNDNENSEIETNDNEDIATTENKIQINVENKIPGNKNQTDHNDQNDETDKINTIITEEIETKIITTIKTNTANKTIPRENTKDGNFTVNINNVNDNLENLEIMDEGVTEENEVQALVNPVDNMQVGNVQVLGLVDDFPLITLEELTSSVVSEGPVLHEGMIDEMQVMMMDEEVPEDLRVIVIEQEATEEDKIEVNAKKEMQDTIENTMEVNTKNKLQITAKDKTQVTAEKMPIIAENRKVTTEKDMEVITEKEMQVTTEKDLQVTTDTEMSKPQAATIDPKVDETNLTPGKDILLTVIGQAENPTSFENQPPSKTLPVEPITPVPKRKRGRPRKVPKDTNDVISNDESTKQTEHDISKQDEQRELSKMSKDIDMSNSLNIITKDQNNSLEIDMTVSSNEDQNESIEQNDELNTSTECSVVKVLKKKGRKKGQKGVKRIVTDIRRSSRLSVKTT